MRPAEAAYLDDAQTSGATCSCGSTLSSRRGHSRHDRKPTPSDSSSDRSPSHDDAVPNANGVFAEALVRLAQPGSEEDRALAGAHWRHCSGVACAAPVGHMSILNALDLHLRGSRLWRTAGRRRVARRGAQMALHEADGLLDHERGPLGREPSGEAFRRSRTDTGPNSPGYGLRGNALLASGHWTPRPSRAGPNDSGSSPLR